MGATLSGDSAAAHRRWSRHCLSASSEPASLPGCLTSGVTLTAGCPPAVCFSVGGADMEGPELLRLVDAIHRERNIDKEQLFQGLEHALLTAARKRYGESAEIFVSIDRETGAVTVVGAGGKKMDLSELGRIAAQV